MAPVNTTGLGASTERATRYAVSSSVSVPCVTTTPSTPGSLTSSAMRPRSAHWRATVMCGPGKRPHGSAVTRATASTPRAAPRISSAERDGIAPPSPASRRIEIVPPVNSATTCGTAGTAAERAAAGPGVPSRGAALTRTARCRRSRSAPRP
jgi:hypothetical protein